MVVGVWDVKSWMEPFVNNMKGHSRYLIFRFTLATEGHSELHYEQHSAVPWEPEGSAISLISVR